MIKIKSFPYIFLFAFFSFAIHAQLKVDKKHWKFVTNYRVSSIRDTIYAFKAVSSKNEAVGSLTAYITDSAKNWRFVWRKYDAQKKAYSDTLLNIIADSVSNIDNLTSGGYQVLISKDSFKTKEYRAWIYVNNGYTLRVLKDNDGYISGLQNTCKALTLYAFASDTFVYYDPISGRALQFDYPLKSIEWTSTPSSSIPAGGKVLYIPIPNPPFVETSYSITVVDTFGNIMKESAKFKPVKTKAEFELKSLKYKYEQGVFARNGELKGSWSETDTSEGEAVLTVNFRNKSINGARFYWSLADTIFKSNKDTADYTRTDTIGKLSYRYHIPYKYKVKLTSESASGCIDTFVKHVTVKDSKIPKSSKEKSGFPNVFTPNNDGMNDRFFYNFDDFESIKWIRFAIFDRRGSKVYFFEGNIDASWRGWDGKTRMKLDAPEGIYYWMLEVEGWGKIQLKPSSSSPQSDNNTSGETPPQKSFIASESSSTTDNSSLQTTNSTRAKAFGYVYLFRK